MLVRSTKWCISDTGFHGVIRWPDRLILLWHGSWAYPLIHIHLFHWNKHCCQEYNYQHVLVKSLDFGSSFLHLSCTHIAKTTTNKQVLTFFFGKMSQIKQDIWLEPNIILQERRGKSCKECNLAHCNWVAGQKSSDNWKQSARTKIQRTGKEINRLWQPKMLQQLVDPTHVEPYTSRRKHV
jgi:hypothetical protein